MGDNTEVAVGTATGQTIFSPSPDKSYAQMRVEQAAAPKTQAERPARRKKASRACYHCQKAHLTCDDSRPCQRCVRKGLAHQCVDGYRKKAKYLLEEDEIPSTASAVTPTESMHHHTTTPRRDSSMLLNNAPDRLSVPHPGAHFTNPSLFGNTTSHGFLRPNDQHAAQNSSRFMRPDVGRSAATDRGSIWSNEPVSLESSILSSMIHDMDYSKQSSDSPDGPSIPAMDLMESYTHIGNMPMGEDEMNQNGVPQPSSTLQSGSMLGQSTQNTFSPLSFVHGPNMPNTTVLGKAPDMTQFDTETSLRCNTEADLSHHAAIQQRPGMPYKPESEIHMDQIWRQRVAKVYRDNTRPFPYTEGYHILLKYATQKYEKADVLRIVRALAIYRPSLIALQMPLSEEDEIFVERAFQRTILEFEKLISFSGTPTVVWRRTCEIAVVGAEFCMLTQWSKDDLMGKYIYQFMDKESVIHYWETFASHAFENTTQSVMTKCTLISPTGKHIPCTWCFTIKRDPFDLPGYVVGNFLPILS